MLRISDRKHLVRIVLALVMIAVLVVPTVAAMGASIMKIEGSTTVYPIAVNSEIPFEVMSGLDLQIAGTGSSAGLTALKSNLIDVGMSSSDYSADPAVSSYRIARDAVCVIVPTEKYNNGVQNLTQAQIKGIWEGNVTNWSALGYTGPDEPIVPRARATTSGTRETLHKWAPISDSLEVNTINATGLPRLDSNAAMKAAIDANDDQIGYVGIGYAVGDPAIKVVKVNGVAATKSNVYTKQFPIWRYLWLMKLNNDPDWFQEIDDYINYMQEPDSGQDHVLAAGFFKMIPDEDVNKNQSINIVDVGMIGGKWNQPCTGCREDVNNNGQVNIVDVGMVGGMWNITYVTN